MRNKGAVIGFLIYLIFGLYFFNNSLNFINLPEFISSLDNWIVFVGGVLLLLGGRCRLEQSE